MPRDQFRGFPGLYLLLVLLKLRQFKPKWAFQMGQKMNHMHLRPADDDAAPASREAGWRARSFNL